MILNQTTVARLSPNDLTAFDECLLDENGRVRLLTSAALRTLPFDQLRAWCIQRGRYGLPTVELLACLTEIIGGRRAIEIGAGMGDLGLHLGIPMTDSYTQTTPEQRSYYAVLGQAVTEPPADVERLDGLAAIEKYKPEVVVASWITQLYLPGDERAPKIGSSVYGLDESEVLRSCETYVHVGNHAVHGDKRMLRKPHVRYVLPNQGLVSRAADQNQNVIYVWGPHATPEAIRV